MIDLQNAGGALAELSASKTSLRKLDIRGDAQGPDVIAAIAGASAVMCGSRASHCSHVICGAGMQLDSEMVAWLHAGFVNLSSLRIRAEPAGYDQESPSYEEHVIVDLHSMRHLVTAAHGGVR
jgi:hypothetical protein